MFSRYATRTLIPNVEGAVVGEAVGASLFRRIELAKCDLASSRRHAMRENFAGLDRCDEEDVVERSAETIEL